MSGATNTVPADGPALASAAQATRAYASASRQGQEEQWILAAMPMVRHIVQKVAANLGRNVDKDELISAGTLGLVQAARSFDSTRDAEFTTFAYLRIRGAVIDELRGRTFVPPTVHTKIRKVQEAYRRFASTTGRPPSDEELADDLAIPVEQLYSLLEEARRQHFLHIHGLSEGDTSMDGLLPVDRGPGPGANIERKELLAQLTQAIMEMPTRDRHVLMLYYERDLTMKEIAIVLKLTESRVSQIHAAALLRLAMKLKKDE